MHSISIIKGNLPRVRKKWNFAQSQISGLLKLNLSQCFHNVSLMMGKMRENFSDLRNFIAECKIYMRITTWHVFWGNKLF